jgi:hypothetical protein
MHVVLLRMVFVTARVLVRRGRMEAAHKVLSVVYGAATPEQVDIKVRAQLLSRGFTFCPSSPFNIAQSPPRGSSTKHRNCRFDYILRTFRLHDINSSQQTGFEYVSDTPF